MSGILSTGRRLGSKGLTLIELSMVLLIMGLLFTLVIPRIPVLGRADLKSTSRRIVQLIDTVGSNAVSKRLHYRLAFDLFDHRYMVSIDQDASEYGIQFKEVDEEGTEGEWVNLPEGIYFGDIVHVGQIDPVKSEGIVYSYFYPDGRVEPPTLIHLTDEREHFYSLFIQPFSGRVDVSDQYEEVDLLGQ